MNKDTPSPWFAKYKDIKINPNGKQFVIRNGDEYLDQGSIVLTGPAFSALKHAAIFHDKKEVDELLEEVIEFYPKATIETVDAVLAHPYPWPASLTQLN